MNRAEMAELFDQHLRNVTVHFEWAEEYPAGQGPLKTYIIEAHDLGGDSATHAGTKAVLEDLQNRLGFRVDATDDPTLVVLGKEHVRYFVDFLNPRFWVVHTTANIDPSEKYLNEAVRGSWNLDYAWLPTQVLDHLRRGRRFLGFNVDFDQGLFVSEGVSDQLTEQTVVFKSRYWGTRGENLYKFLSTAPFNGVLCLSAVKYSISDPASGAYIQNQLNAQGRILATGNSISLHLGAVNHLVNLYAQMIQALEKDLGLAFVHGDDGDELQGYPLTLRFSKPVPDFAGLVGGILSCGEPVRFWGVVSHEEKDFARAEVVDLHSASRLRLDFTPTHIVVYLFKGSCGNSVARLLRIVQEHLDPAVYFALEQPTVLDQCKEA
jgi:hypothetical protein